MGGVGDVDPQPGAVDALVDAADDVAGRISRLIRAAKRCCTAVVSCSEVYGALSNTTVPWSCPGGRWSSAGGTGPTQ